MTALAGAIGFGGQGAAGGIAEQLARTSTRYPHEAYCEIYGSAWMRMYVVGSGSPPSYAAGEGDDGVPWWVVGDVDHDWGSVMEDQHRSGISMSSAAGRYIELRAYERTQTLRVATDRLGVLWLYTATLPDGVMFATDFGALARQLRDRLTIDYDTVLLELSVGYSPDEHTVFNEIQIAPPGAILELTGAGISRASVQQIEYGDRYVGASREEKFQVLDSIYADITTAIRRRDEITVSISAGFDSRYCLAFLDKHGVRPSLCTFGDLESEEVMWARAISARVDRETSVFTIPTGNWEQWQRCIHLLGNAGMTQWAGWAESWLRHLRSYGPFPVIGYLGDALSGKHLVIRPHRADWLESWIQWSSEHGWAGSALLRPDARDRVGKALDGRFRACLGGARYALPHQAAMHLDLYGRQRRWVASQPNLISRFATPVLFFYDANLLDFWTNVSIDDLDRQRLYLAYAEDRFPSLFRPEDRHRPSIARRAIRKATRLLTGRAVERRPPVVDHRRLIEPYREHIVQLVGTVGHVMEPVMDMKGFVAAVRADPGADAAIPSSMVLRAVNVLMLLDLAHGRQ